MAAADFRDRLLRGLGGPWPEPCPLDVQVREVQRRDGYRIETITYQVEPGDRVPAHLLIPDGATAEKPAPAVAVWHQHNGAFGIGKTEPAGLGGSEMHHTGVALAKEGYVAICPDALCFGERQDATGRLKGHWYERFQFLEYVLQGKSLAWKNILDMRRAVDVLVARPEVRADRLGCYGHSMGSTHTWLVGPWEPRLVCLVGNCCLPTYRAIRDEHMLHCFPNFVPGLVPHGDTPDIAALVAPRALHLNFGETDGGSPIAEVRRGLRVIEDAYASMHAEKNFSWFVEEGVGHVLSPAMWEKTKAVFAKHLKK